MTDNARLHELTKLLAVEMTISTGELWRTEINNNWWTTQIHSDTAYISLSLDGYKPPVRLKAWTSTPAFITALRGSETISMNADRDPASLAAYITRRLLTPARVFLVQCRASQDEHDRQQRKEQLIKNLLSHYLLKNQYDTFYSADHKIHSADVRTNYIDMRLSVSPTDAIKIAKLLKGE